MSRISTLETMPPTIVGKASDRAIQPVSSSDDFRFHALLYPNRSLSRTGFVQLMAVIIGVNVLNAIVYLTLGAWPVAIFCGLDILIVWWAFKLNYHHGRLHERIMLTDDTLWICRVSPSGHESRWKLTPAWLKVHFDRPARHESHIKLIEKGRTLIIGSFLAPAERDELARSLVDAIYAMPGRR